MQSSPGSRTIRLRVADIVDESPDARSFVFAAENGTDLPLKYRPGQFLTLRLPGAPGEKSVARCYSLASSPFLGAAPKVTVKRVRDGYGSNWLCDNVTVGDVLETLPPSGLFSPRDLDVDLQLWAGGSGITPIMSILESALVTGTAQVTLVYANRDENHVIFAAALRELSERYPQRLTVIHWLESVQGLPAHAQLTALAERIGGEAFICGPSAFMSTVKQVLLDTGAAPDTVHTEVFSSLTGDPFAAGTAVTDLPAEQEAGPAADAQIHLDGVHHTLSWPRAATLVDVMVAAGLSVPYSCREGQCGSCAATLLRGAVDMDETGILDKDDIAAGTILACQSRPDSDNVEIEF